MDATAAIEHNLEALKRVLAGLVAMAGLSLPLALSAASARAAGKTLPRHLHRAILRLLRPAESAARRLIIASAGGMAVALPPPRKPKPMQPSADPILRRLGIAVVVPPSYLRGVVPLVRTGSMRDGKGTGEAGAARIPCLPLFDPPRRLLPRRRTVPARSAPRILLPGFSSPAPRLPLPSPHDPVDTTRLGLRLAALAAALDDLPRQAMRFARWRARCAVRQTPGSIGRTSPLRPGRPPGGRRPSYDPSASRSRSVREIDEVLAHAHALALYALRRPDTS